MVASYLRDLLAYSVGNTSQFEQRHGFKHDLSTKGRVNFEIEKTFDVDVQTD